MEPNQNQLKPLDDDEQCSHRDVTQKRCALPREENSPFCTAHLADIENVAERRAKARARSVQLSEEAELDLFSSQHDLRTRRDVQETWAKVFRAFLHGKIKRADAAVMLPMLAQGGYKMAKDLEGQGGTNHQNVLNIININGGDRTEFQLNDTQLDAYLSGDESLKVHLLQDLNAQGKIKRNQNTAIIDAGSVDTSKIKIPHKTLSKFSRETDIEITAKESLDLFGEVLADAETMTQTLDRDKRRDYPNTEGFDHLWTKDNKGKSKGLPEGLKELQHNYIKRAGEPNELGFSTLFYDCIGCGVTHTRENLEEECPAVKR